MFRKTMIALASSAAITMAGAAYAQGQGGGHGGHGGQGAQGGHQGGAAGAPAQNSARDMARENSQGPANASPKGIENANENSVLSTDTTTNAAGAKARAKDRDDGPTIVRAGPNAGQVINKRSKKKTEDLDDEPGSQATTRSQGPANASPTGIANASDNSVLARGAVAASQLQGLNTGLTVKTSGGVTLGTVTQVITGPNDTIRAIVVTSADGQTYTLQANTLSLSGGMVTTTASVGG